MKIQPKWNFLSRLDGGPLRIAVLYSLIGSIWILASDRLASEISPNEYTFTVISTVKGWIYVLITGLLLYGLIKRYIHSLQEAEKRLVHAFSKTMMSIWEWDLQTNNILWSPVLFDAAGVNKEDLAGQRNSFNDLIHPEDVDGLMDSARKAMKNEDMFMAEFRIIRPNGEVRWLSNMGRPELDPTNNRLYLVGTVQDITEQKQVEQTLRESEQRYRSLFEGSPVAIWEEDFSEVKKHLDSLKEKGVTDFEAYFSSHPEAIRNLAAMIRIRDINKAAVRMYRAKSKQELIESTNEFESKEELEQIRSALIAIGEGMSSGCWEGADETVTGETIEISTSWSIVPGHEQDYARAIVTTIDVTERKRADAALRESETYIKAVMDNLPLGVAVNSVDPSVNFEYMNDNFPAIYRTTREALADPDAFWESVYEDPDFREEIKKRVLDDCASGDPKRMHWEDVPIEHKGAEAAFISAMNTPVPGKPLVISTVWDTTARKQAEENYRNIFENSLHGIFRSTPTGRFIMVNPALARIWGYDSPEDLLTSVTDTARQVYVDPNGRAEHTRRLKEQGGSITGFEYQAYRKDGTTIWISEDVRSVTDADGALLYYEGAVEDISERKEAEEKLRASEERFTQLANNIQEAFWMTDIESGREIYLSPIAEMIWGKSVEEMMASPTSFLEMILPEDREAVMSAGAKHRSGEKTDIEYRVQQPDGSVHWVWDRAFPIYDDKGKVTRIAGLAADITERKQAEEALLASESRFRVIFEKANDAIHIDNANDEILAVNPRMCELMGYSREELLQMHVADLQAPEKRKAGKVIKDELARHGSSIFEGLDLHRDGRRVPVEISIGRIELASEDLYVSVVRDITERKQAEEKLRASEERFRQLADNIHEAFWITDVESNEEIYISPAAEMIWGRTVEELIKPPTAFLEMVLPEDRDYVVSVLAKQRSGEKTEMEYRIRQPNGSVRWVWDRAFPILDDSGRVKTLAGIVADVTERKQAAVSLEQSEALFRALFELSPDAVVLLDPFDPKVSWPIVDCNSAACLMNGYRREELVGHSIDIINVTSGTEVERIAYLQRLRDEGTIKLETFHRHKNGTLFPIEVSTTLLKIGERELVIGIDRDITERKRAAEALENAETRYRVLFEQSPTGLLLIEAETGKTIEANETAYRQLGYTQEEFAALRISDYEVLEKPEETAERMQKIMRTGSDDFETLQRTKSGDIRNVHVWAKTLRLGDHVLLSAIFQDITERKIAENAVRESEQFLTEAQKIAGLGSYVLDISSGIWKSSMILDQIFGIDKTFTYSLEGWLELVHPDWRERMADYFANEVLGKHGRFDKEYKIVRKDDGAERWVHGLGELEIDDQNRPVKMHGTIQDITEHREVEEQLRHQAALLESVNDAIVASDAQDRLTAWNQAAESLYGWKAEEVLGRKALEILRTEWPIAKAEEMRRSIAEAGGWRGEASQVRKDGTRIPVEVSSLVRRDDRGKIVGYVSVNHDITKRRANETALRESESRYRSLFEDSPISLWEEDLSAVKARLDALRREGITDFPAYFAVHPEVVAECASLVKVVDVNWATLVLFKAENKVELYENLGALLQGAPGHQFENELISIAAGKNNYQSELINLTLDGNQIDVDLSWSVAPSHEDDMSKVIVTIIDITERKRADIEIRRHLAELQALYENGLAVSRLLEPQKIGSQLISTFERYLSWHHVTIRLRKQESDDLELVAFGLPNLTEEDRGAAEQNFTAEIGKVGLGMSGWVMQTGEPLRTADVNKYPQYVEVYEGIHSGLYMPLKAGDRVIGVISVESEEPDAFTPQDERLLATLANQAAIAFENARLYRTAQQEIAERERMENLLADERNQLAIRVEERTSDLSRANSNLARALRVKDEFLANMSHELRTPLNAILGLSESLSEQIAGPLNEKQLKYTTTIGESGHHLLSLINDILDLAKIEAGQITLDINKVDLHSVCQASLRMIKQLAQKKNQDVKLAIDAEIGLMWADERRLKQMMVNLLSNAVKFTPENGEIGLEVHRDRIEDKVTIDVWDNGIGISENDLSRLFQPFVQLDSGLAREASGTGLGLTLVAQMARLHGGGVTMKSEPGKGSRFTISLPWEPALSRDPEAKKRVTGELRALDKNAENQRTILLIEDTKEVVMLVTDYLEAAGFRVVTAQDGVDGLIQVKLTRPDLILMDLMMPRMDGFETTQKLRSDPQFKSTPIIALTALAMPRDRERCLEAGMNEYISKPVHLRSLVKMINGFLFSDEEVKP